MSRVDLPMARSFSLAQIDALSGEQIGALTVADLAAVLRVTHT